MGAETFALRHNWRNICALIGVAALIQLLLVYLTVSDETPALNVVTYSVLLWAFVTFRVAALAAYRVVIADEVLAVKASFRSHWRRLPLGSITKVEIVHNGSLMTGTADKLPADRVEFRGQSEDCLAVSLTHFRAQDVRRLLQHLARSRPNLQLPSI